MRVHGTVFEVAGLLQLRGSEHTEDRYVVDRQMNMRAIHRGHISAPCTMPCIARGFIVSGRSLTKTMPPHGV